MGKYNCRLKRERRYDIKEKRRKHKEIYQIDSFSKLEIYKVIMMKTKQARKKKKGATWFLSFQRSFLRLKEKRNGFFFSKKSMVSSFNFRIKKQTTSIERRKKKKKISRYTNEP